MPVSELCRISRKVLFSPRSWRSPMTPGPTVLIATCTYWHCGFLQFQYHVELLYDSSNDQQLLPVRFKLGRNMVGSIVACSSCFEADFCRACSTDH